MLQSGQAQEGLSDMLLGCAGARPRRVMASAQVKGITSGTPLRGMLTEATRAVFLSPHKPFAVCHLTCRPMAQERIARLRADVMSLIWLNICIGRAIGVTFHGRELTAVSKSLGRMDGLETFSACIAFSRSKRSFRAAQHPRTANQLLLWKEVL